ncbi:MAG: carboxylating nicotinate-nucleotide diphosphorylase [Nitrososphaerales archaeon]
MLVEDKLRRLLEEDLGRGDITSEVLIDSQTNIEGEIFCKEECIVGGLREASTLFEMYGCRVNPMVREGEKVRRNSKILRLRGNAGTILALERTALNLMMRMSGIATETDQILSAVKASNPSLIIAGTRKTAPGMNVFDKRAISIGGGDTHRLGLDDALLIKDNHIAIVGSIKKAVKKAKSKTSFTKKIEVEVRDGREAEEAASAGADIILLDNLSPSQIRAVIKDLKQKKHRDDLLIEASGGINRNNVREYARTGVDVISIGALTHSVKSIDMSLKVLDRSSK